jgi:Kef-type K+ transport system membrane component KefB
MTNASTTRGQHATTTVRIRWGRIVLGAVLLEAVLIVAAIPLLGFVANPLAPGAQNASGDYTIFFVSVAVACFVVGTLAGWWVARPLSSQFKLHGALTGIVATAIYLGICSIPPTTIPAVVAAYGPSWFFLANGLRVIGATLGAAYHGRKRLG